MMPEPKVRFKRDDGSSYPDFVDKKLGDIGTVLMCKRVFREQTSSTGDVPFYKIGTFGGVPDAFISRELYEELKAKYSFPKRGNVLLSAAGTIGRTVRYDGEDAFFQDSNIVWLDHDDSVLDDYLYYFYQQASWKNLEGGTIQRLYNGILLDKDISIPCEEEQQKIADFLSSVDEVIAASEKEVANLETQKKAVMKKIFSQEVRFKREDGSDFPEWEEKRIGDICKTYSGGTPKAGNDEYYGGDIPFIRSGEIHSDSTELFLSDAGMKSSSAKMVAVGDIIMALYGATSGEIDISRIEGAINQAILCIKPDKGFNKKFIVEVFRNYKDEILKTYLQGGQGNLSAQIVQALSFDFPCLEEQNLIADFFTDFDEAIAAAKKELELWKELKKGLLQQMFV